MIRLMPRPTRPTSWPLRRRLTLRLGAGMPAGQAARAEGVAPAEVEALLAEPDFALMVEAFREFEALPREERLRVLERHAWLVLQNALIDGDLRVAIFVAGELQRRRDPARTLAEGVVRVCERAGRAPSPPEPPPPAGPAVADPAPPAATRERHRDFAARVREGAAAHARALVLAEQATTLRAAAAEPIAPADVAAVVGLPTPAPTPAPTAIVRPRSSAVPAVARAATARAVRLAGCATAVGLCLSPRHGPDRSAVAGGATRWPGGPPFSRHDPA